MAGIFAKALGFGLAGTATAFAAGEYAAASGDAIIATRHPWNFQPQFSTFDHQALRRGFQVYRQVCAACHSLKWIEFRHLVGITHTEEELKDMAAEYDVIAKKKYGGLDIPIPHDDTGKPFTRKGELNDRIPGPYENDTEAKLANNGALPPDFLYIRHARTSHLDNIFNGSKMGEDYIFSLLTGYCDPPAGVELGEGMHYNPYFVGGAIGMGAPLYNEIIQYEDGTPATLSQLAADVTQFLTFVSMPEHDDRKMLWAKCVGPTLLCIATSWWWKRYIFAGIKSTKLSWRMLGSSKTKK